MSLLARRYAKAIFEVAEGKDALDAVDADLGRLGRALHDPAVRTAVLSPDNSSEVRRRIFDQLLGEAHELTKNLVGVLLRRRRESVLVDLHGAFKALVHESRGKVVGVVETAMTIDEAGLKAIEAHAGKLVGKTVTLEVVVNPDLIGGVRLRLGNALYDGSVATVLEDLERALMEAPI